MQLFSKLFDKIHQKPKQMCITIGSVISPLRNMECLNSIYKSEKLWNNLNI